MTRLALALLLTLLVTPALAGDPAEGVWRTLPDDDGYVGEIVIAPCEDKLCGTLVRAFDAQGRPWRSPYLGRNIVWAMVAEGGGQYGGGWVWAPDRDKIYRAKMELAGDRLAVSGCVMRGMICRASEWTRAR